MSDDTWALVPVEPLPPRDPVGTALDPSVVAMIKRVSGAPPKPGDILEVNLFDGTKVWRQVMRDDGLWYPVE